MLVELVGRRAELIGPALADRADQVLQAVLVVHQVLGQGVEQFGVGRRVGDAHVVERIDDAPAEEVGPVAIGDGPGEERVLRVDHPVDQLRAADPVPTLATDSSPSSGRMTAGCLVRLLMTLPLPSEHRQFASDLLALLARTRHRNRLLRRRGRIERGQAPVIVLAPLLVRVVVAVGAQAMRRPRNTWLVSSTNCSGVA